MAVPNHKGPPSLPSESGHGVVGPRRLKFGEVMTSPLVSRTVPATPQPPAAKLPQTEDRRRQSTPEPSAAVKRPGTPERRWPKTPAPAPMAAVVKRSPSTETRRPSTPGDSGENTAAAAKLLGGLSRKSLSFSFQGDSFSIPTRDTKPKPAPATGQVGSVTRAAAEGRRATTENSKSIDQRRWPGLREGKSLTRSNTDLKQFVMEEGFDPVASDTESVHSERSGHEQQRRSTVATPLQDTTNPNNNEANTLLAPLKINAMNKLSNIDSPNSTPQSHSSSSKGTTVFSPFRGAFSRPASPSRRPTSSSASSTPRGMPSPSRVRAGAVNDCLSNVTSVLSFGDEVRRGGKVVAMENMVVDAHMLRLVYNRYLQWRFFNARADVENAYKKITTEKSLYNAWVAILILQRSVASKRAEIQLLQRSLKLHTILKRQMVYLNDWGVIDEDNSSSLSGATKALESSTLRLPVVGGAKANIQNVKDAICSAVDVMQAMASSVGCLLPKVNKVNLVMSDLAHVTSQERAFLEQCKDLLSMLTAVQVMDFSMRTHLIQLSREGSSLRTEEEEEADFIDKGKPF